MKNNYICHTPYLRNSITYGHDFWYNCVKWWYLEAFFYFFEMFIFGAVMGVNGKKQPKMKNNYIYHTPYLRSSTTYGHDFWYTCVKWWYLEAFFSFFWTFHFLGCQSGVIKRAKKHLQQLHPSHAVSQEH